MGVCDSMMKPCRALIAKGITLLFVYGTLRRGFDCPMARMLAFHAKYLGPARLNGWLYRVGSYPGLVPTRQNNEWVRGDLYDLGHCSGLLTRLDRYEGIKNGRRSRAEYQRQTALVQSGDGTTQQAWIYRYRWPVNRLKRLASGDFLRERRRHPYRRQL